MKKNDILRRRLVFCVVEALVSSASGSGLPVKPANKTKNINLLRARQAQQKAEELARQKAIRRAKFEPAANMLNVVGVTFDPYTLMEDDGPKRLKPFFNQMPEMQEVRYETEALEGVHFADTLYLPERVDLSGDTVILARKVVFEGKSVLIKGNHNIAFLPMEKVGVLGARLPEHLRSKFRSFSSNGLRRSSVHADQLKSEEIPEVNRGQITIDVSGRGYEDWLASIGGEQKLKSAIKSLYSPHKNVRENALREFKALQGKGRISKRARNTKQQRVAFKPGDTSGGLRDGLIAAKYLGGAGESRFRSALISTAFSQNPANGQEGAMGDPGDAGTPSLPPNPATQPKNSNGVCSMDFNTRNGLQGLDGAEPTPAGTAGTGRQGSPGGNAGSISGVTIPDNDGNAWNFQSRGGRGGKGGPGGFAYPGQNGGDGGAGGDGANCPCAQGGAGNGGKGGKAGDGASGGRGGDGGPGGPGGNGGSVSYSRPGDSCFFGSITTNVSKGGAGLPGDGSPAGMPGQAGTQGAGGQPGGNSNCPSTNGMSLGPGESGQGGFPRSNGDNGNNAGVSEGSDGSHNPTVRTCPGSGDECNEGNCPDTCLGPVNFSQYPETGCPGTADSNGQCCYEPTPILIDILGNGFSLTDAAGGVSFDN